jgi:hypothetical protein
MLSYLFLVPKEQINPSNVGKTTMNHPPVITILIGGINLPFPVMAGL